MRKCLDCERHESEGFYSECESQHKQSLFGLSDKGRIDRTSVERIEHILFPVLPLILNGIKGPFGSVSFEDGGYGYLAEMLCPGVYRVFADSRRRIPPLFSEFLAVTEDSPAISSKARKYGILLPTDPRIYIFDNDYLSQGRRVVEYEAHKYLTEHDFPLPKGCSLISDRSFGMEICPEYFGEFPIPTETPWGEPLRCEYLRNGLYWLETETLGWVLAVAYPLCCDLWNDTAALAALTEYDRINGVDSTCGYRFFTYETSCLVLFELQFGTESAWKEKINNEALQNAILKYYPDYGSGDGYNGPIFSTSEEFRANPDAGIVFYSFP